MGSQVLLHEAAGWYWFFPFWILFWVGVVFLLFRFAPWRGRSRRGPGAQEILAERFARGEIDAAEYTARREVLGQ
jgi:putative membrane protein